MKSEITQEVLRKWGVYKITNIITGDFYIGSTTETFKKRIFYKHISDYYIWKNDKKRRSTCPMLYNAFEKYGIENFKAEVLIYFNRKKSSEINEKIATFLEGRFIRKLNAKYNICKYPEKSGCPNLGRKLDEEWKKKIGEKSKLYKHTNNKQIYDLKSKQNKNLSSVYIVEKDGVLFEGSAKECAEFLNINKTLIFRDYIKKKYNIIKKKSQKKSIKLIDIEKNELVFMSYGECDRFLNMWKGFTSTQIVNNKNKILDYDYELL